MSIANVVSLFSVPSAYGYVSYTASEGLMNLLKANKIRPISGERQYKAGAKIYFRNKGTCTVCFLPDGRIHVLDAPIAMWTLHDTLSQEELRVLIAFCSLEEEEQQAMRDAMAPFCDSFIGILHRLPKAHGAWKQKFLQAYHAIELY